MSGSNPKRSRKSKLVPREDSDNLQDEPKKKVPKKRKIDNDTPTTSSYRPPQFDIKIEVEECDEYQIETSTDFASNSEIKTEMINENDLFEVEEHAINSFLAQALNKNKEDLTKKKEEEKSIRNKIAFQNDHGYSQSDVGNNLKENPSTSVYHLKIHEDIILDTLDELLKGNMSPIDKMLGIELRNLLGRCRVVKHNQSLAEIKIQLALNSPKTNRKLPFIYKCYMCEKAWWHLKPFQDHMNCHTERFRIIHELQQFKHLYNLTALSSRSCQTYKDIKIEERCWRCGNDYEHHRTSYYCEYCNLCFDTCTSFKSHEGECITLLKHLVKKGPLVVFTCHICNLKVIRKEDLEKHYEDFHDVRSDLPRDVVVRNCSTCSEPYASMKFHYCLAKNHTLACNHCSRKFPSRQALDIHLERQTDFPCPACNYHLPKKCIFLEHFLKHSEKFNMLYKCYYCEGNVMLLSYNSITIHKSIWHIKTMDKANCKRKILVDKVLVPRKLLGTLKSQDLSVPFDGSVDSIEAMNTIDSPTPAIEFKVDSTIENNTNVVDEPSSVIIDQEFEELNDSILNQTMVEGMNKNNLPEEEEGYEYMLSSIFNNANSSNIDTKIAAEEDCLEELIMTNDIEELIKSRKKKLKKKKLAVTTAEDVTTTGGNVTTVEDVTLVEDVTTVKDVTTAEDVITFEDVTAVEDVTTIEDVTTVEDITTVEDVTTVDDVTTVEDVTTFEEVPTISSDERNTHVEVTVGGQIKLSKCTVTEIDSIENNEVIDKKIDIGAGVIGAQELIGVLAALLKNLSPSDTKCIACRRPFDRRTDRKRHYIEHLLSNALAARHVYNGLRCQLCFAAFDETDAYRQHMRYHANLPVYKCDLCPKTFCDASNRNKHRKKHRLHIICPICKKKVPTTACLAQHMEETHMEIVSMNKKQLNKQRGETSDDSSQDATPVQIANSQDSETPAVEVQIDYDSEYITDKELTRSTIIQQNVENPKENVTDSSDSDVEEIDVHNVTETIDLVDEPSSDIESNYELKNHNATKAKDLVEKPLFSIEIKQEPVDQNDTGTMNLNEPRISIQIKQEVIELENQNVTDNLDFNDQKSNLGIKVKQENDVDDCAVKKKMIEGMKNDNSLAEDEGGYEFILSSIFNTSNSSNVKTEIAEEKDEFDESISISKQTKVTKKAKKSIPTQKASPQKVTATKPPPIKSYKCSFSDCTFVAYDKKNLKIHVKSHKDDRKKAVMTCSQCNKWFMTVKGYVEHLPEHGYAKWTCPDCSKGYVSSAGLMAHLKVKAIRSFKKIPVVDKVQDKIVVSYKCKVCKMSVDRQSVVNHWETHLVVDVPDIVKVEIKEELEYLDECGEQFAQQNDGQVVDRAAYNMTQEVMERVLGALEENTRRAGHKCCIACGRTFERRNDCKRHHIEHLLANAYSTKVMYKGLRCQRCHSVFERPDVYKHHMRAHGHLPVHKCDLCFKTFSDSSNYVKHKKTHKAMFICDICNKKFIAKLSLIKHLEGCHRSTEPIICLHCPRQFFTKTDLSRHMRSTHTKGQFKFICLICRKRFISLKDKWDHMWIEHRERPVRADCPICSAEFRKVSDVKKHLTTQHTMEVSVMDTKLFKELMHKIKSGMGIEYVNELVTVKREENKNYVIAKHKSKRRDFEVYNRNDLMELVKNELVKKELKESL